MARGYNLVRGVGAPQVMWSTGVLDELVRSALLGYLAVAHYGRGRGNWTEAELPGFWHDHVDAVVQRGNATLAEIWKQRAPSGGSSDRDDSAASGRAMTGSMRSFFEQASAAVLARLYPRPDPQAVAESTRATQQT